MARAKPWFRIHNTIVDNPKIQMLPDSLVRPWLNLVAVSNGNGGVLPALDHVAFKLRMTETDVKLLLETFQKRRLFDDTPEGWKPHDWDDWQFQSDVSTDRVQEFRKRQKETKRNVSETPTETDQRQSRADIQATPGADAPLKARIFGPCLEWLAKQTRQDPNKLRALVGKWCSKHGDGKTLEAISAAQTSAALDPIPYITRILGRGGKSPGGTDWAGASADQVGEMGADVRSAWGACRTIDGEFSPSAQHGAGEPGPVPAGGSGPEAVDAGVRDAERGPGRGAGGIPQDAGSVAGGPACAGGGADHHDLEMGRETPSAGGHSRDGARGPHAADDAGEQSQDGGAAGGSPTAPAGVKGAGHTENIGRGAGRNPGAVSATKPDFDAVRDMPPFMRRTA